MRISCALALAVTEYVEVTGIERSAARVVVAVAVETVAFWAAVAGAVDAVAAVRATTTAETAHHLRGCRGRHLPVGPSRRAGRACSRIIRSAKSPVGDPPACAHPAQHPFDIILGSLHSGRVSRRLGSPGVERPRPRGPCEESPVASPLTVARRIAHVERPRLGDLQQLPVSGAAGSRVRREC